MEPSLISEGNHEEKLLALGPVLASMVPSLISGGKIRRPPSTTGRPCASLVRSLISEGNDETGEVLDSLGGLQWSPR